MKVEIRSPGELTTIGIGIPRKIFIPESIRELSSLLRDGFKVVGGGSNIVLSDRGKPLISLESFKKIKLKGQFLTLGPGVKLSEVLKLQQTWKFSLFEFLSGIPKATVGGLVAQNAGAFGREIKEFLYSVEYLDIETGEILKLNREEILSSFSYRKSPFPQKGVIISATFKVTPDEGVKEKIRKVVNERLRRHPPFYLKTSGSTFKNPTGSYAGKILDECGLKGLKIGNLYFSEIHANFLINKGKATFSEFLEIVNTAKERVKKEKNVELELEIKIV